MVTHEHVNVARTSMLVVCQRVAIEGHKREAGAVGLVKARNLRQVLNDAILRCWRACGR